MKDRISIEFLDGVADVRLIRADKMNALDPAMFEGIIAAGAELAKMIRAAGIEVRAAVRKREALYAELNLADASDDQLLDFMLAHPILINRPIVVTPKGTKLCRPSEAVLDLLDHPAASFVKEDGEAVTRAKS